MNVHDNRFEPRELAHISPQQAADLVGVTLEAGDVLLNITGASVARCCSVPRAVLPARVNQHVAILRADPSKAEGKFIEYALTSPYGKSRLLGLAQGGATREALTKAGLERFEIPLPPLVTQRKIAAILWAYDNLIENCQRRIKILEEMAHRIYREWFVDFRYPGHEHVPLVDSELGLIPQDWTVARWGQLAELKYGRALRNYKGATGRYPVFGTNGQIGWHDEALFPPGVVVGRKGAYRGIHLSDQPCWVIDTAFYLHLHSAAQLDPAYAYHQLTTVDLDEIDSGSAIPSTSRDAFYSIRVVRPPPDLIRLFASTVRDLDTVRRVLSSTSSVARLARDLLVPRLVTGEIDVEDLDIAVPEVAA
jgi:type I restriction enzyme, S subunit